jgi:hypothetical protein
MKIYSDLNLRNFEFWSGAKDHKFTYEELKKIEFHIEEFYPNGVDETTINDLFWFEEKFLCEVIGVDYNNEYLER